MAQTFLREPRMFLIRSLTESISECSAGNVLCTVFSVVYRAILLNFSHERHFLFGTFTQYQSCISVQKGKEREAPYHCCNIRKRSFKCNGKH